MCDQTVGDWGSIDVCWSVAHVVRVVFFRANCQVRLRSGVQVAYWVFRLRLNFDIILIYSRNEQTLYFKSFFFFVDDNRSVPANVNRPHAEWMKLNCSIIVCSVNHSTNIGFASAYTECFNWICKILGKFPISYTRLWSKSIRQWHIRNDAYWTRALDYGQTVVVKLLWRN